MACGLALLASGQAFATEYYSVGIPIVDGDLTNGTKWMLDSMLCGTGGTAGTGTIAMAAADSLIVCPGHSLNTGATLTAGKLVFDGVGAGGAWGGTALKFDAGNKWIVNSRTGVTITINRLELSAMATGNTILIKTNPVKFADVTGRSLECPAGTAYTLGDPIAANTTCTVGAVVVTNSVSAPIFSTKEKPAVFSEEVK